MSVPKTQRAWGDYSKCSGDFIGAGPERWDSQTPVIVAPESAVKRCMHVESDRCGDLSACINCGARRWGGEKWQRPRILRVGRASK